jgi:phage-related protein
LGKALNDPIKGMTALGRAGVTFTKGQQSQIKALVKSGDLLGAQKIILGEVKSQTGGAAAASATAGEKMKTAWNNAKESLGTALLPALDKLQIFITTKIIPAITKFVGFLQKNPGVVKAFGIALAVVAGVLLAIFIAANALIIGVGLLVVAFALVAGWIIKNWDKIKAKTVSIWNGIKTFLANVWNWIKTRPGVVWSWIKAKISGAWDAIKNKTKTTWDAIKNWIRDKLIQMGDAVRDKIRAIIQWFKDLPGKVKTALGNLKNTLLNAGKNLVQGFIDGIKNKFAAVKSKLTELKNKLTSWKGPPSADRVLLTRNGQLIIEGLIRGFESRKPAVRSSLRGMTSTIGSLPASGFAGPRMSSVGPAAPAGPMTATLVDPTIRVEKDGLVRLVDTRININDHAGALRTRFA